MTAQPKNKGTQRARPKRKKNEKLKDLVRRRKNEPYLHLNQMGLAFISTKKRLAFLILNERRLAFTPAKWGSPSPQQGKARLHLNKVKLASTTAKQGRPWLYQNKGDFDHSKTGLASTLTKAKEEGSLVEDESTPTVKVVL